MSSDQCIGRVLRAPISEYGVRSHAGKPFYSGRALASASTYDNNLLARKIGHTASFPYSNSSGVGTPAHAANVKNYAASQFSGWTYPHASGRTVYIMSHVQLGHARSHNILYGFNFAS
jgi:hypothetical protein